VYTSGLTGTAEQHVKFHLPETFQTAVQAAVMVYDVQLEEKQKLFLF
jgi:hypothetical protein